MITSQQLFNASHSEGGTFGCCQVLLPAPFEVVSGRASGATSSQHCGTVCTYHSITCIDSGEEKCVYVLINSLIKSMQSISHVAANAAVTFHWLVLGSQWLVYTFT